MIWAIFSLSGKTPVDNERFISFTSGSDIRSKEFLIICVGTLSTPGAFPDLKALHICRSSLTSVGFIIIGALLFSIRNERNETSTGGIFLRV
jgi:hypothetical protein